MFMSNIIKVNFKQKQKARKKALFMSNCVIYLIGSIVGALYLILMIKVISP